MRKSARHFICGLGRIEKMEKEAICTEQIYNCNETGLNFKMLPSKTLISRNGKFAPGYYRRKKRVTILAYNKQEVNTS